MKSICSTISIWIVSLLTSISCTVIHNFYLIHFYFLFHFCLFVYVFPSISMLHSNLNSVFPQLGLFASLRIYHPMWGTLGFANWEAGLGSWMVNLCNIFFLQHFFLLPVYSDNTLFTFISIVHNFFAFPDLHFLLFPFFSYRVCDVQISVQKQIIWANWTLQLQLRIIPSRKNCKKWKQVQTDDPIFCTRPDLLKVGAWYLMRGAMWGMKGHLHGEVASMSLQVVKKYLHWKYFCKPYFKGLPEIFFW